MEDLYYSKKLDKHFPTRLDVLLYAHDGRGLGHASRAIAIGMALKRCYPTLRVLFVTGANISQSLIGNSSLDWIKLPSYASMVTNGVSTGINGPANFYKSVLGKHRSAMLTQIVESFKPKCILVDHNPLGKRKELIDALTLAKNCDTKCFLGLRAVIGTQKDFWSPAYARTFEEYYENILWYGDSSIVPPTHLERINEHFSCQAEEMGYVSRLYETRQLLKEGEKKLTGLLSIPWFSEHSWHFLTQLSVALNQRDTNEKWVLYLNADEVEKAANLFSSLPHCRIKPVGDQYNKDLLEAQIGLVYSGYNSLMDVLAAGLPAILLRREMKDQEQDIHVQQLTHACPDKLAPLNDCEATSETINQTINRLLQLKPVDSSINLLGSQNTADFLVSRCGF